MSHPSRSPARLPGRVLLTGVSSGIGEAAAKYLLSQGWEVVGLSRRAPAISDPALHWVEVDLVSEDAVDAALDQVGPVDAIVHAAGILRPGTLETLERADGWAMWRLHVDVATQIVARMAPQLPQGGRIVLIGSRTAAGSPGRSQYAASKAALLAMARSWAKELIGAQICVNVVAPGATDTPMLNAPERAGLAPNLPPMGNFVDPSEVAATIGFLLSPGMKSLTGQQIMICAGASL
ncbi:NAD(P)-dependent dehydrogenase (short-subunit alcohol dehydrogenase family) [Rhodobacter sp. JA431]|uniref:SDR family NAD(P)-dependent oxidoreductase n=1 Tax=Rhodobacter sp. JA431 TaxID=570013 RepID=UPI000BDA9290|nr:SDR family oxidoreductase [Rhodobacter sp. JA431]SOC07677.1 NAD(P)-dependent dehydrogenase (short-subunit alcohol dehydrogenase family) [Rhodobacter sp. JA431]